VRVLDIPVRLFLRYCENGICTAASGLERQCDRCRQSKARWRRSEAGREESRRSSRKYRQRRGQ